MPNKTSSLLGEYQMLFDICVINASRYPVIDAHVRKITDNRKRYEIVCEQTGVPWHVIGIIHLMESAGKFTAHLHNGDPLSSKTTNVPKGRPLFGNPPYSWEISAVDALKLRNLHKVMDWNVPETLYQLEGYNGFGYRQQKINSPYLWSFSNHYTKGKYTSDGVYNSNAVSKQIGAAVLLRRIAELQLLSFNQLDRKALIRSLCEEVKYAPSHYSKSAEDLQRLLSQAGHPVKIDGYPGKLTSNAAFANTGKYLKKDPRREN